MHPDPPMPGPSTPCCATNVRESPTVSVDDLPLATTRKSDPPHTLLGESAELQATPMKARDATATAYQLRIRMRSLLPCVNGALLPPPAGEWIDAAHAPRKGLVAGAVIRSALRRADRRAMHDAPG